MMMTRSVPTDWWFCAQILTLAWIAATAAPAWAATAASLQPGQIYRVAKIHFHGNRNVSDGELLAQMKTKERPFYQVWKTRPEFNPGAFETDLKQLKRLYQINGYYQAVVHYDLSIADHLVTVDIDITENKPVLVQSIDLRVDDSGQRPEPSSYKQILKPGDVFTQQAYEKIAENLRTQFFNRGCAHVQVKRQALVNTSVNRARISYFVQPGVPAVFGDTKVEGTRNVSPTVVLRELQYRPGEEFSQTKIEESRARIVKLDLFAMVRFNPQLETGNPKVVPITIVVQERPKHSIKAGGGYNTESQVVANLQWSDRNWLGDGRKLSLLAQYSNIDSMLVANFTQPYMFGIRALSGVVDVREDIQQVPPYTLFATRILPHLNYEFSSSLSGYLGFRAEYAKLTAVDPSVIRALGPLRESGFLFGPYIGLVLNTTDDPYNPHHGYALTADAIQGGGGFGGKYSFYRFEAEAKHYQDVGWGTILATRLKVGTGDSLGSKSDYPLFYRFYAGGEGSVRGYGYWRLGPTSSNDVPLGGLSDIEGSLEARHQIWEALWGALFLDFGQLSLHPYDLPVSNLRFAAGPAVSYMTPVGPVRVDLGFPFKKPQGQAGWQVYFSIGQFF